ncbi:MAG: SH3 domain-containing protein, partial [Thermomicrobiales bacterium]
GGAASAPASAETDAGTGTRYADGALNLRSGPSVKDGILSVLPGGAAVELSGESSNGFAEVSTDAGSGWIAAEFLLSSPPAAEPEQMASETGTRFTDDALNLRSGPSLSDGVIDILPMGTQVELSGLANGEFVEITTNAGTGWVAGQFLMASQPAQESTQASLITWPIQGGTWSVLQGYNGSSHQNRSDLWQYKYSIDLVYEDGSTAGQPVYSPVSGTVRFYDEETGGISIDMGNGYAFAMFHAIYDAGIPEGATVSQGQYLGYIANAGEAASGRNAHLHITIWETDDGGNWSRRAVPFVGNLALSGVEFPDQGQSSDHTGALVNP